MEKLTKQDLENLISLCGLRVIDQEAEVRRQAAEGLSIASIKNTITHIDYLKSLSAKLIEIKKGV